MGLSMAGITADNRRPRELVPDRELFERIVRFVERPALHIHMDQSGA
jgi:hypothetical protein